MKAQQFSYRIYPFVAVVLLLSVNAFFVADNAVAQTKPLIIDTPHCIALGNKYETLGDYQKKYDTARKYIEDCAELSYSYHTFLPLGSANEKRTSDYGKYYELREWLKKVLYYNLDTNFYCSDVSEMLATFTWFDNKRGRDYRGILAVQRYIKNSGKCPLPFGNDSIDMWTGCHKVWNDTVNDRIATPFDSTLPTLEDLDLGILRGPISGVVAFNNAIIGPVISNLRALENPFTSETTIAFDCREAVALKFEVYDILGKKVYDGGSHRYDRGSNKVVLSGDGLASGILYARFSNPNGFVSTVKLRHR